ncbi:SRPBCC domain-containing protein [Clostridium swellfunianum]|uniref:SRPBCC family protein n=1 Tax=Clostridium swellfunianum TaxID=1367462 RepID=UPI00202F2381|nr:SRPBCC domain-containing protein [Clostridium swellfunianum]MCM0649104.1 SRPBCC domain-containing protein [Clostridium swellfunianum]
MNSLEFEIDIISSKEQLWSAWTSSENVSRWFSPLANVEPMLGGAFELFFDPSNLNHMTTKGCTFLELTPFEKLSFNWKGPDDFSELMNSEPLTVVNVLFFEENANVKVKVSHSGWGTGDEWDAAKNWHEFAWNQVLSSLKNFVESNQGNICCSK